MGNPYPVVLLCSGSTPNLDREGERPICLLYKSIYSNQLIWVILYPADSIKPSRCHCIHFERLFLGRLNDKSDGGTTNLTEK